MIQSRQNYAKIIQKYAVMQKYCKVYKGMQKYAMVIKRLQRMQEHICLPCQELNDLVREALKKKKRISYGFLP